MSRNLCSIEHTELNLGGQGLLGLQTAYQLMHSLELCESRQINTSIALCEIYLELNINHDFVLQELELLESSLAQEGNESRIPETVKYCKTLCLVRMRNRNSEVKMQPFNTKFPFSASNRNCMMPPTLKMPLYPRLEVVDRLII